MTLHIVGKNSNQTIFYDFVKPLINSDMNIIEQFTHHMVSRISNLEIRIFNHPYLFNLLFLMSKQYTYILHRYVIGTHDWNFLKKCIEQLTYISFSSSNTQFYESRIFCLFIFWVFFPDKSFKLISKCTQKCQYNSLY